MKVGIAEDQALVRESLAIVLGLEQDVDVEWTAATGAEAVEFARIAPVDLVLMDLRLPDIDGVTAMRRIRVQQPDTAFIVLTTFHHDEWLLESLNAGAAACFLKEVPPNLLLDAMRKIRNNAWNHPSEWSADWRRFAPEIQFQTRVAPQTSGAQVESLTPREIDILRRICAGATNQEIASSLHLSEGTVKNYVSLLYSKLGVRHRAEAVKIALERGL